MKPIFDAIGIDIGTRNARCAYAGRAEKIGKNSQPVTIPNRWGKTSTSSFIGWDGDWLIGEDAISLFRQGSDSVWGDVKRKIGTDFAVVCDGTRYEAQNVITHLLIALREDAEVFLGRFVSSCVLVVPAYFTPHQREILAQAAEEAGMTSVRMISEPAAAAIAFGREGRFLVMDCGAGVADISVIESESGAWQILERAEGVNIGGDFDLTLAGWLAERLRLGHMPENDPRQRALLLEAEAIKIALSSCLAYDWKPPSLDNREIPALRIEREELERMMRFSIKRLTNMVARLWEKHKPERLLLLGGASNIPILRDLLEQKITRPEALNLCAEELVAAGAALYAFAGQEPQSYESTPTGHQMRDLKMRLVLIEPSLDQVQRERLHLMVNKLENLEASPSSIEILEGVVKALEAEFSQKN